MLSKTLRRVGQRTNLVVPYRRARRVVRNRFPRAGTIATRRAPRSVRPLGEFRLFAVLGTWMEADVVEACVRNAFAQGVERVFLVDNDSPDDTVAIAEAAGATLAVSYSTRVYDEPMRIGIMNGVMRQESFAAGSPHVWWLWLDADEFPHGPGGATVRDFLARLDQRYRVVGAHYYDHFPSATPAYVSGEHPIDRMPVCERCTQLPNCVAPDGHYKHPLIRVDDGAPAITVQTGFHRATANVPLYEPEQHIFVHHFQYREEVATRARLQALCDGAGGGERAGGGGRRIAFMDEIEGRTWRGGTSATLRFLALDDVYRQVGDADAVVPPGRKPWAEQVDARDVPISR